MTTPVIAGACRTAIGTFMGSLSSVPATELGAVVARETLRRAGVAPDQVDEVLFGCALQSGLGAGPARQAAMSAGLPETVPATTVNMLCGSGLRAVANAAQAIRAGDAEVILAGGMESMSRVPHVAPGLRSGQRLGDITLKDAMLSDGLWCSLTDQHMGSTAENIARDFEVSREDQDAFAAESQRRAAAAIAAGRFASEIVPVAVPQRRGEPVQVDTDEHPRPDATVEGLAGLKPAFNQGGTVTAGNASGINDGAATMIVASEGRAEALGLTPQARILGYAWTGTNPNTMGMGPVTAAPEALERAGLTLNQVEVIELNEAFAAQALAVERSLGLDPEITNVNGGAIALGHPVGASGARVLVTLLHELERRRARYGLATLCIGGGMGIAMVVESLAA